MADLGAAWLLGGGIMQLPLAKEIKRRGYNLLLTDLDPNCACRPLADHFGQVSVYGIADNMEFARSLNFTPVAVLTVATDAGEEVATLAQYFGLPGIDPSVARRVQSKALMRQALDLPHPQCAIGNSFGEWDIYPCVVKASNSSGSKGFSVVRRSGELPGAIQRACKANRSGGVVVIEELLESKDVMPELYEFDTSEVALDFFIENGRVHYANSALRLFHRNRPGIEAGHLNPFVPGFVPDFEIMELAALAAKKLGVTWGPFKLDLKQDSRYGWCILEAAVRLSGGFDHGFSCPMATGKNITGAMLDIALGLPLDMNKLEPKQNRVACCLAPIHKPGKINGWLETGLIDGQVFYRTHTEIKPLESNADRPVFVLADGADWREAYGKATEAAGRIEPVYV